MIAKASNSNLPSGDHIAASILVFLDNDEPSLAEVIADETVRRMMVRDGVDPEQLLALLDQVRTRLA